MPVQLFADTPLCRVIAEGLVAVQIKLQPARCRKMTAYAANVCWLQTMQATWQQQRQTRDSKGGAIWRKVAIGKGDDVRPAAAVGACLAAAGTGGSR